MGSLVYTLFSMVQVASLHCSQRPEISPCSCKPHDFFNNTIHVSCAGLASFNQVFDSLQNKFSLKDHIWLEIKKSQLDDLETRNFKDMNMNITKLYLNYDELRTLPESSFRNMSNLSYLSLAENQLKEIPRHILLHMPKIVTMDLGSGYIEKISTEDFSSLKDIRYLILVNNKIKIVEKDSIPKTVRILHLGKNNLTSLNGTIRNNENIDVVFLNENSLTTLDDELPVRSIYFKSLSAHHNKLQNLTRDLGDFPYLDTVYLSDNELKSLNRVFQNASLLQTLSVSKNKIEYLAEDEFIRTTELQELELSHNYIKATNNSLLTLNKMRICNLSQNLIAEFSLNEVRGLRNLQVMDLSHNRIDKLTGRMENLVEQDLFFNDLRLNHNLLKSLDGAMMNLNKLKSLDLSFNKLKWISPDDLIGLEILESLNVSHNYLQTLEETSMAFLPKLEKLYVTYNNLTKLENDFHGLPGLCYADLSNNHITFISPNLVAKTKCINHGVVNKLEIVLQENPILCMDELPKLMGIMEAQETRLLGFAHCIVPKEEIMVASSPIFDSQPIPLLQETEPREAKLPISTRSMTQSKDDIMQLLVPLDNDKSNAVGSTDTQIYQAENMNHSNAAPMQDESARLILSDDSVVNTVATTTNAYTPNPNENNVEIVTKTEKSVLLQLDLAKDMKSSFDVIQVVENVSNAQITSVLELNTERSDTVPTLSSSLSSLPPTQSTMATLVTAPPQPATVTPKAHIAPVPTKPSIAEIILGELESISKSPEPDNYIYETFSPMSPMNIGSVSSTQRNDHIVIAEEPPENIPNDAVLSS